MTVHLSTRRAPKPKGPRKPAVGRRVDYYAPGAPTGRRPPEALRATILEVIDAEEGLVRLQVVDPYRCFMTLEARLSEKPKPGHWSWPLRA